MILKKIYKENRRFFNWYLILVFSRGMNGVYYKVVINPLSKQYTEKAIKDIKKKLIEIDCAFISNLVSHYDV